MTIATPYLMVLLYTLLPILAGLTLLLALVPKKVFGYNLFLNLGLAWCLGHALLIPLLYGLLFANRLDLVNPAALFVSLATLAVALASLAVRLTGTKKYRIRFFLPNLILLAFTAFLVWPLVKHSLWSPLNAWDALAIWELKAKALLEPIPLWQNSFFTDPDFWFAHQDYPLGLPLLMNAYFRLAGSAHDQALQFYLLFYYLAIGWLLIGAVRQYLRKTVPLSLAAVTAVMFLTIPSFVIYSHNGFADIPLACFFLGSLFFLTDYDADKNPSAIPLALLLALISSAIKMEGYFFVASLLFVLVLSISVKKKWPELVKPRFLLSVGTVFVIGLWPVLAWEGYKAGAGIQSSLGQSALNPNLFWAVKTIVHRYLNEIVNTAKYSLSVVPAVMVYLVQLPHLVLGRKWTALIPNLLPFVLLSFYTLVYLITPNPLLWQLDNSFDRLFIHILPLIYLLIIYNFYIDGKKGAPDQR